jgi:hypothetical protein
MEIARDLERCVGIIVPEAKTLLREGDELKRVISSKD